MTEEIKRRIESDFHLSDQKSIFSLIEKIYETEWSVGKEQLVLSLIKLSSGSLDKLLTYFPIIDPRDIILEATKLCNNLSER